MLLKWWWPNTGGGKLFASRPPFSVWTKDSPSINNATLKCVGILPENIRSDFYDQKDLHSTFRNTVL